MSETTTTEAPNAYKVRAQFIKAHKLATVCRLAGLDGYFENDVTWQAIAAAADVNTPSYETIDIVREMLYVEHDIAGYVPALSTFPVALDAIVAQYGAL